MNQVREDARLDEISDPYFYVGHVTVTVKDGVVQLQQDQFKGMEHLGSFPRLGEGAAPICNPANLTSVIKVPNGKLQLMRASVP